MVSILRESDNLVSQHLAVEAIGIVDIKSQQFIVLDALRRRNNRFGDAAIAACRFISRIPDEAKLRIIILLRGRAVSAMLFPPKDQTYLFKNADVFSTVHRDLSLAKLEIFLNL